jgi:Na+-translocating ferredoxin:NAD+ oxidoreductase RnfG subunit
MSELRSPIGTLTPFAALVVACAVLLALVAAATRPRIEANRERQFSATLAALTGHDVAAADLEWHGDRAALCGGLVVLRGTAAGYAGTIRWLAAADLTDGAVRLNGLRIVAHQETPGIADFLDQPEAGWLVSLRGLDAAALASADTVSGATISTRALRRELAGALDALVAEPSAPAPECGP